MSGPEGLVKSIMRTMGAPKQHDAAHCQVVIDKIKASIKAIKLMRRQLDKFAAAPHDRDDLREKAFVDFAGWLVSLQAQNLKWLESWEQELVRANEREAESMRIRETAATLSSVQ